MKKYLIKFGAFGGKTIISISDSVLIYIAAIAALNRKIKQIENQTNNVWLVKIAIQCTLAFII